MGVKLKENQSFGPLGQPGVVSQIFWPLEGGLPIVFLVKSGKSRDLEIQVSFFRIFCPRREDPRLVIHLKSGKLDPWKNRCCFSGFFAPGGLPVACNPFEIRLRGEGQEVIWDHLFDIVWTFSDFFQDCDPVFLGCSGTMK